MQISTKQLWVAASPDSTFFSVCATGYSLQVHMSVVNIADCGNSGKNDSGNIPIICHTRNITFPHNDC